MSNEPVMSWCVQSRMPMNGVDKIKSTSTMLYPSQQYEAVFLFRICQNNSGNGRKATRYQFHMLTNSSEKNVT